VISRDIVRRLLEAGVQAPSGSNSQPWTFEVKDSEIRVRMLPEKDHPILNFRNRGTLLAHGALIENIAVAAAHYGLGCEIRLLPDKADSNLVAKIWLFEGQKVKDETLFDVIFRRTTNRKPYSTEPVGEGAKHALLSVLSEIGGQREVGLKLIDDRTQIEVLAGAASANEIVMLENELLHELFFDEIVWTKHELRQKKAGLYLKTMELRPPQRIAIHLFRRWPVMRLLNRLGAARSIARGNARNYAACGSYGAVLCGNDDKDFMEAGRVIERAWLKATALGLSFHLQTGVNFLWLRQAEEGQGILSNEHLSIIRQEYEKILRTFDAEGKIIPAIFRIGYDGGPTARSPKKAPEATFR
jgi:hypothetical protein